MQKHCSHDVHILLNWHDMLKSRCLTIENTKTAKTVITWMSMICTQSGQLVLEVIYQQLNVLTSWHIPCFATFSLSCEENCMAWWFPFMCSKFCWFFFQMRRCACFCFRKKFLEINFLFLLMMKLISCHTSVRDSSLVLKFFECKASACTIVIASQRYG